MGEVPRRSRLSKHLAEMGDQRRPLGSMFIQYVQRFKNQTSAELSRQVTKIKQEKVGRGTRTTAWRTWGTRSRGREAGVMRPVLPPGVSRACPGPGKATDALFPWGPHLPALPRGWPPSAAWPWRSDSQGVGGQSRPPSSWRTCWGSCLRPAGSCERPRRPPRVLVHVLTQPSWTHQGSARVPMLPGLPVCSCMYESGLHGLTGGRPRSSPARPPRVLVHIRVQALTGSPGVCPRSSPAHCLPGPEPLPCAAPGPCPASSWSPTSPPVCSILPPSCAPRPHMKSPILPPATPGCG